MAENQAKPQALIHCTTPTDGMQMNRTGVSQTKASGYGRGAKPKTMMHGSKETWQKREEEEGGREWQNVS